MSTRDLSLRRKAAVTGRAAVWLVVLPMLLVFPLQHGHSSLSHFRAHEARRAVVRHTLLAPTPANTAAEESHKYSIAFGGELEDCMESATENCTIPTTPVKFYLTRLKLGPSHSGTQDPLLH